MKKILIFIFLTTISCQTPFDNKNEGFSFKLNDKELNDKILGSLVGSAIGDAMGAPTEMWPRNEIRTYYGFVDKLDSMNRMPSPEGVWKSFLKPGGTTDDTRWKMLSSNYFLNLTSPVLDPKSFAAFIVHNYENNIRNYGRINGTEVAPFEENYLRVAWLQEWAGVGKAFLSDNLSEYSKSLSKFYGGEMVCAGLLFAPTIGSFYPENPKLAYLNQYNIDIYDIGYARDISGLCAAMTAVAMKKNAKKQDLLDVLRSIDPNEYSKSRLIGRNSLKILENAIKIASDAKENKSEIKIEIKPNNLLNKEEIRSFQRAYNLLDLHLQDYPFHAGEVWLQVLTAMIVTDFDYLKTLAFLVNYGRDNDTTAAIAGGILGAFYGYEKLPKSLSLKVLKLNKEELKLDLEGTAELLTKKVLSFKKK